MFSISTIALKSIISALILAITSSISPFIHAEEAVVIGDWCDVNSYYPNVCDAAFRVDLVTGKRTLLSTFTKDDYDSLKLTSPSQLIVDRSGIGWQKVAIAPSGDLFVYATNNEQNRGLSIYRIAPNDGSRQLISNLGDIKSGPLIREPYSIFATPTNQILVGERFKIFSVNPLTGKRITLSDDDFPSQGPTFNALRGIDQNGRFWGDGNDGLVEINPNTGMRTIIKSVQDADYYPHYDFSSSTYFHLLGSANKDFYFIDSDLYTDMRTYYSGILVSDSHNLTQGPTIQLPIAAKWSSDGRIIIVDNGGTENLGGIYSINPHTGNRTLISNFLDENQGPLVYKARDLAVGTMPAFVGNGGSSGTGTNQPPATTTSQIGIGSPFTFTGQGYGLAKGKLLIGKTNAKIRSWTDTNIIFVIPNLKAGNYPVKIFNKKGQLVTTASITILAPTLTGLSSNTVSKGTTLTITGSSFGTAKPKVYFKLGNKKTTLSVLKGFSDTSVTVKIPRLKAGAYQVLLNNSAGISTNGLALQVQ